MSLAEQGSDLSQFDFSFPVGQDYWSTRGIGWVRAEHKTVLAR